MILHSVTISPCLDRFFLFLISPQNYSCHSVHLNLFICLDGVVKLIEVNTSLHDLQRQASSFHNQISLALCFWSCICQTQPKLLQILRGQCCLDLLYHHFHHNMIKVTSAAKTFGQVSQGLFLFCLDFPAILNKYFLATEAFKM